MNPIFLRALLIRIQSYTNLAALVCVALLVTVVPAYGMSGDWNRQEFSADHFAIQLPVELKSSKAEVLGPSGQRLMSNVYRVQEQAATFEVVVLDLPGMTDEAALTWGAKVVTGDGKVRVAVTERIDRIFGRNLTIDFPDGGRASAAVFYVKNKLYLLQGRVTGTSVASMASDAMRFQQSLEFIGYGFEAGRPENRGAENAGGAPSRPDGRPLQPPPEAFADCEGKKAGEAVQHKTPRGIVAAHCVNTPLGLAARPDQPLRGAPQGPPPDRRD